MKEDSNSLLDKNPMLAAEWHPSKNNNLTPADVTIGSNKKVWWLGICGHEWDASIKSRACGRGCPICSGRRVVSGINDLGSKNPQLAMQWDYEKNKPLKPTMVTEKSNKAVWWICERGHNFCASIDSRTRGRGCPYCGRKKVLSGETDLKSQNPFLFEEYSDKNEISADNVFAHSHKKVLWKCSFCNYEWTATIKSRMQGNGCPMCAKRMQTSFPEQALFFYIKQSYPDALNRYKEIFNNNMELDIFIPSQKIGIEYDGKNWHKGSVEKDREKVKYQICKEKDIFLIRIKEDLSDSDAYCDQLLFVKGSMEEVFKELSQFLMIPDAIDVSKDRIKILSEYTQAAISNSFASQYPEIAKEWNYDKNGELRPDMYKTYSTQAQVWWKCSKGHEWQSTIAHRTSMNSNCPYCANRKLLKGFNDFQTTNNNQQLLVEWNYNRNELEGIAPDSLMEGSQKKVWWKCSKGHEWKTTISERKRGTGCPFCAGKKVLVGFNDLASVYPEIAKEWNHEKNNGLTPQDVTSCSNKNVWWRCEKGHEWRTMILTRSKGSGCPYCSNRYTKKGFNDLSTLFPHVATEWNIEKNNDLSPEMVTPGSGIRVWWKCQKCGYEWQSAVKYRTRGHGCPICAREK